MLVKTLINASIVVSFLPFLVSALSPGSFFFQNVFFSGRRAFSGLGPGVPVGGQGLAVGTSLPQALTDTVLSNQIFTIDSTMTNMLHEESQQFAVVDASNGGTPGSGIILSPSLFPAPPFNPIGNSDWTFVQGSQGMMIVLAGRNLAWSLLTPAFGTQVCLVVFMPLTRSDLVGKITIQTLNTSDLRQQWTFIAHGLV